MLLTTDLFRLLIISSYHAPSRRPRTEEGRRSWRPNPSNGNLHVLAFSVRAVTFVQHPHDNEPILVAGGQLLVLLVPGDHLHRACRCLGQASGYFPKARLASLTSASLCTPDAPNSPVNTTDLPLWPSRVWFMDRLLGAARPLTLASSTDSEAKINWNCPRNSK